MAEEGEIEESVSSLDEEEETSSSESSSSINSSMSSSTEDSDDEYWLNTIHSSIYKPSQKYGSEYKTLIHGQPIKFIYRYKDFLYDLHKRTRKMKVWDGDDLILELRYPLSGTFRFPISNPGGWTYDNLIRAICKTYIRIYREEEETMDEPLQSSGQLVNRPASNGKYGIWGHHLSDLGLGDITISNDGIVNVSVES